jgi:hypothetical protein
VSFVSFRNTLFQFGGNHKLSLCGIVLNMQQVGFATDLAVFYVGQGAAGGVVYHCRVPLAAACALEARFHENILPFKNRHYNVRAVTALGANDL